MQGLGAQAQNQTTWVPTWLCHRLLARQLGENFSIAAHLKMRLVTVPCMLAVAIKLLNMNKGLGQCLEQNKLP